MSNKKIIFQVLSDLHLERFADFLHKSHLSYSRPIPSTAKKLINDYLLCPFRWIYTHPKTADYLLLVGDIGNPNLLNYEYYLTYCSSRYKQVFIISGNHEYHFPYIFQHSNNVDKMWIHNTENKIRTITAKYSNVHYLQNNHILLNHSIYNNILLYGSTLWSPIPQSLKTNGYDLYKIPHWSWTMRNKIHLDHYNGIIDFLKYNNNCYSNNKNNKDTQSPYHKLIMTHYLPSRTLLLPKWKNTEHSTLFASSIWEELNKTQHHDDIKSINAWLYGHTHQSSRNLLKSQDINPIFFANPIGNIESEYKSVDDIVESFETNVHISLED
jgi:hypothetical protein